MTDLLFIVVLFLLPNIPLIVKGIYGSFLTYTLASIILVVLSPRVVVRKGLGKIGFTSVLITSVSLCLVYVLSGLLIGLNVRTYRSFTSFTTSFMLLVINIASVEVSRSLVIGLLRDTKLKAILGVAVGLFFGRTLLSLKSYLTQISSEPVPLIGDLIFSLITTLLHIDSSFASAIAFRLITGFFWKLSPLIPNTGVLGEAWISFESLAIIVAYISMHMFEAQVPRRFSFPEKRPLASKLSSVLATLTLMFSVFMLILIVFGNFVPLSITSNSMSPNLKAGDLVFVKKTDDYNVGEVIAYRYLDAIIVHRVVDKSQAGFITKGDNNNDVDPFPVSNLQILGEVVFKLPFIGWVPILFKSIVEKNYLFVLLPIFALGLIFLYKRILHMLKM